VATTVTPFAELDATAEPALAEPALAEPALAQLHLQTSCA
jgi:hypothetical protein